MRLRHRAFLGGGGYVFLQTLTGTVYDYNVRNAAIAAGWNGVERLTATINVTATGVMLASYYASKGFVTGTLPLGSSVTLNNAGQIWGTRGLGNSGGNTSGSNGGLGLQGGDAVVASAPLFINNTGTIAGGGGGGGGGGGAYAPGLGGGNDAFAAGGAGGNGEGYNSPATSGVAGYTSNPVGGAIASSGYGGDGGLAGLNGGAGSTASVTAGGAAGTGGALGAAGLAVVGGEYVTWASVGTVRGAVSYGVGTATHIATPASTPATGTALEGGFYSGGLLWQEVARSDSLLTLASNYLMKWQVLRVPAAASAPMFYTGQQLEIRSRANPANKFFASVLVASGENLSVQISNAFGAIGSAFSDWSIMSRYRIIVAPKVGGETTLAVAIGAIPAECWTLNEGRAATQAMASAGDATQYPAAHWASGLSIGGYSDWYVPARDELERIWRFLKPATVNNYTTADRPTGSALPYAVNGAVGDTSPSHGINPNATATGNAYNTSSPARTGVAVFQAGGAQAMEYGTAIYASSTGYDAADLWAQSYQTAAPGKQITQAKEAATLIRAVRRSII